MNIWYNGGDGVKQLIPDGYIGNPSNINIDKDASFEEALINDYVKQFLSPINIIKNELILPMYRTADLQVSA